MVKSSPEAADDVTAVPADDGPGSLNKIVSQQGVILDMPMRVMHQATAEGLHWAAIALDHSGVRQRQQQAAEYILAGARHVLDNYVHARQSSFVVPSIPLTSPSRMAVP